MNSVRCSLVKLVLLGVILFCPVVGSAQENISPLQCVFEPDTLCCSHTVSPTDTLNAIVIYACSTGAPLGTLLPSWKDDIWNPNVQLSVPRFYLDNSAGKYLITAAAYGRDSTHCFTSSVAGATYLSYGFFKSIMDTADVYINFGNYDTDGPNGSPDGVVDGLFFVVVNHNAMGGTEGFNYRTHDVNSHGDTVEVSQYRSIRGTVDYSNSWDRAVYLCAHEWGHRLGLPDLYGTFICDSPCFKPLSWGLGSFSIMGQGFPVLRPVPFDPWSRIKLNWITPTVVTAPIYQQSIQDCIKTGTVYKLTVSDSEYFLVSNHKGVDLAFDSLGFWEAQMPGSRGGLMIWHVDETQKLPIQGGKKIDAELAHGLWNFPAPYFKPDTLNPNPSSGKDSLDIAIVTINWDQDTLIGYTYPTIASATCYWNQDTKINFDGLSNPSSDGYNPSNVKTQNVPTHFAVRNVSKATKSNATADLLVNNWYGHITANTTWGPGVYAITGDVTVDSGKTLTIAAGTTIKFQKDYDNQHSGGDTTKSRIIVKGTLTASGDVSDSIILTSSASSPANGDWGGLFFETSGSGTLEFVRISYADTAIRAKSGSGTVTVRNCTFNKFKSIAVYSQRATVNLGKTTISPPDCGKNNILMKSATSGAKAVTNAASSGTLYASGNWWDTTSVPSSWFSGNVNKDWVFSGPATPDSCPNDFNNGPSQGGGDPKVAVVPLKFELSQNYPNPFNPTTTIKYSIPKEAKVELKIYNMLGQLVRTLVNQEREPGVYEVSWDGTDQSGRNVSSGIYLYQIRAGDFVKKMKMTLMK